MKKWTQFPVLGATLFFIFVSGSAQDSGKYLYNPLLAGWDADEMYQQTLPVDDTWWLVFGDAVLDSLIQAAVDRNYSLLSAIENIQSARVSWRTVQGGYFPVLSLGAGWTRQKTSGNTTGTPEDWYGYYNAGLSMSWEIDVFGSIRQKAKAQKQMYRASQEEYRAVMVSLCAQVATSYFQLRQFQQELRVLQDNAASQKSIMEITEVRYNTGLASKLDVAQAKSVYYSTIASIPSIEASIIQAKNSLAVLISVYPEGLSHWLDSVNQLPTYIEPVSIGIPAQLLLRRPDVRKAEQVVASKAALLGASKSDWFPSFYLNGSFGYAAGELKHLIKKESMTWEIAPTLTWNLFNGGQTYNATRLARIELDNAITTFNSTVLTAVQEVENAMALYKNAIKQMIALREAVNQAIETLDLSLDLYKQGLTTFQNVLDAQRTLLSYQESLVQAQGYSLTSLVQLYEALGGGWQI